MEFLFQEGTNTLSLKIADKVIKKKELYHYTNISMKDEELKKLPVTALKILTEAKKNIEAVYAENNDLIIKLESNEEFYRFHDGATTLNSDEQLKVYKILEDIELKLKNEDQSNPEIQKLLAYNQDFKKNLHTLPKSVIKKKAIQLLSKVRKYGIKLFYDTLEVGYKEIIKLALHSGMDGIHHLM